MDSKFQLRSVASLWTIVAVVVGLALNSHSVQAQASCSNPNAKVGTCISLLECPVLLNLLKNTSRTDEQTTFLQQSQCDGPQPPYVCCTEDINFAPNGLLPVPNQCGHPPFGNKIYNGNDTLLDEYPWMALLEYRDKNRKLVLNCGGSLINNRYVITAAHCLKGQIEKEVGPLTRIRLGEYNLNEEIDCVGNDCNNKVVEVGYEKLIPHPDYDPADINNYHDIALIRLAKDVEYTDFIRPVCLPLPSIRQDINPGELLIVAGWGRTLESRQSAIKQHLAIRVNDPTECAKKFSVRKVNLIGSQLCAGGEFAKDSCDGDSGGPLMRQSYKKRWFLEGVVSFGNRCGLEGWPGVYTKVADYMGWIQENVKP